MRRIAAFFLSTLLICSGGVDAQGINAARYMQRDTDGPVLRLYNSVAPTYTEWGHVGTPVIVSAGNIGGPEMVIAYNLKYEMIGGTPVHRLHYMDAPALWLALNNAGACFQFAPGTHADGDVWALGGYQTPWCVDKQGLMSIQGPEFKSTFAGVLQMGTNNQTMWQFNTAGSWQPIPDNTYDLGNTTHRVRDGYFGASVQTPKVESPTGTVFVAGEVLLDTPASATSGDRYLVIGTDGKIRRSSIGPGQ